MIDAEFCATKGQTATSASESIKEYALKRPDVIEEQLKEYAGDIITNTALTQSAHITLYPNIVTDKIGISSDERIETVKIVSTSGIELLEEQVNGTTYQRDLSGLPAGIYYVTISTATSYQTEKIIKQ
jgi:hypothetical protein